MMINQDKKIELYYDHYKDTMYYLVNYLHKRNKYFIVVLILIVILLFMLMNPAAVTLTLKSWTKKEFGESIPIEFEYVNSFLLFCLLWVLILYFQINMIISKQFKYLHGLEEKLSTFLDPLEISREGKYYYLKRPVLSKVITKIYKVVIPIILILSISMKLVFEIKMFEEFSIQNFIFDVIICLLIIGITLLYMFWRNKWR